jgi:hypothetical protein
MGRHSGRPSRADFASFAAFCFSLGGVLQKEEKVTKVVPWPKVTEQLEGRALSRPIILGRIPTSEVSRPHGRCYRRGVSSVLGRRAAASLPIMGRHSGRPSRAGFARAAGSPSSVVTRGRFFDGPHFGIAGALYPALGSRDEQVYWRDNHAGRVLGDFVGRPVAITHREPDAISEPC